MYAMPRRPVSASGPAPSWLQAAAADKGVQARNKYVADAAGSKQEWAKRKAEVDGEVEKQRKAKEDAEGASVQRRIRAAEAVACLQLANAMQCTAGSSAGDKAAQAASLAGQQHCAVDKDTGLTA
jgi:hypothetical protein